MTTRQIPALCRLFNSQNVIEHILPLTVRAVRDDVASVRETAVASVSTRLCFYKYFSIKKIKKF
jgi:hypothetical protein